MSKKKTGILLVMITALFAVVATAGFNSRRNELKQSSATESDGFNVTGYSYITITNVSPEFIASAEKLAKDYKLVLVEYPDMPSITRARKFSRQGNIIKIEEFDDSSIKVSGRGYDFFIDKLLKDLDSTAKLDRKTYQSASKEFVQNSIEAQEIYEKWKTEGMTSESEGMVGGMKGVGQDYFSIEVIAEKDSLDELRSQLKDLD